VVGEIRRQLGLLRAGGIVVSTNLLLRLDGTPRSSQPQPSDRGVAVYFTLPRRRKSVSDPLTSTSHVLACDKWNRVEDNLWAVAKHIEALRGQQRWGVGSVEQAFTGYQSLPAATDTDAGAWWVVLGVDRAADLEAIKAAYRAKAKVTHPDVGGSSEAFNRIQQAYEQAMNSHP
jgi:hypothetical protein